MPFWLPLHRVKGILTVEDAEILVVFCMSWELSLQCLCDDTKSQGRHSFSWKMGNNGRENLDTLKLGFCQIRHASHLEPWDLEWHLLLKGCWMFPRVTKNDTAVSGKKLTEVRHVKGMDRLLSALSLFTLKWQGLKWSVPSKWTKR